MGVDLKVMRILDTLAAGNPVIKMLGMYVVEATAGRVTIAMDVTERMANSNGICHGGFLFTLADQAAGYACVSRNERAVTQTASINYISPAQLGERLIAEAVELARTKRSGTYDVRITGTDDRLVALFRGQFVVIGPEILPDA